MGFGVRQAVSKDEQEHNAINRELNLTWADRLPDTNRIIAGEWWQPEDSRGVSIEKELAGHLGIQLGDQLTFSVSGVEFTHEVTSIRQVQWESFRPNFYMIFPRAVLADLPASWLNSFYLPAENRLFLNRLIQQFPTLTLLDLDAMINQVRNMLAQATIAVEAMLFALLLVGLLVMASVVESSIDERLHEGALVRSFGSSRRQMLVIQLSEFCMVGLLSGLLAAAGTELCSYWLNSRVFELDWQPLPWLWIGIPFIGAALLGVSGWLSIRKVVRQSPAVVLREV